MSTSSDAAVADDEPGVAPPPRPVALDVRPAALTGVEHCSVGPHAPGCYGRGGRRGAPPAARRARASAGTAPTGTSGNTDASTTWTLARPHTSPSSSTGAHRQRRRQVVDTAGPRRSWALDDRRERRRGEQLVDDAASVREAPGELDGEQHGVTGHVGTEVVEGGDLDAVALQHGAGDEGVHVDVDFRAQPQGDGQPGVVAGSTPTSTPDARSSAGEPMAPAATTTASASTTRPSVRRTAGARSPSSTMRGLDAAHHASPTSRGRRRPP